MDDTTVYGCTLKTLDDQSLAVDLSSDQALKAQCGMLKVTCNLQYVQNQASNVSSSLN